jgi:hypothetical protein
MVSFFFSFPGAGAHLFFPQLILCWRWWFWLFFKYSNTVVAILSLFCWSPICQSTASLAIDMAPSPICHSTASLTIDMAISDKEVFSDALSNANKAIDMGPSDKEVLDDALSNAKISKKPSPPSSSAYSNGTSDKEVSSDEEEQLLLMQPNAVDLMVNKEDKQCLLTQLDAVDGTTEVTNKRGSSQSIKKRKGPTNGSSWSEKKNSIQRSPMLTWLTCWKKYQLLMPMILCFRLLRWRILTKMTKKKTMTRCLQ